MTIDAAVAVALAAVIGVLLAGLAGLGGALLGARIGAKAIRTAAEAALDESRDEREEARRARFADRVRELAARMLGTAERYAPALRDHLFPASLWEAPPRPELGDGFLLVARELRLLVRSPSTLDSIDAFIAAVGLLDRFAPYPGRPGRSGAARRLKTEEIRDFHASYQRFTEAAEAFELAVRQELDRAA